MNYKSKIPAKVLTRIHEVLGPGWVNPVEKILSNPRLQRLIEEGSVIDRKHDIPYLAGSNKTGGKTYIDRRLPARIEVDGKQIDPAKYLNVHEQVERELMVSLKIPYENAHKIAETYERLAVESDGVPWMAYERVLDGFISETEHERIKSAPKDLYAKPYSKVLKNRLKRHAELA